MTEIEIKARVADPVATEEILRGFATLEKETTKSDVYWAREDGRRGGRHDAQTLTAAISTVMTFAFAVSAAVSVIAGADKRIAIGICLGGFAFTAILSWALKRELRRRRPESNPAGRDGSIDSNEPARPIKVRIRDESGSIVVTYKRKELQDDVEVNDEREFTIDDRAAFESLIADLGFKPYIAKVKSTKTFAYRAPDGTEVSIELSLVAGLGWFAELEILACEPDEGQIAAARRTLRSTLALMGIPEAAIEARYYTDMLREAAALDRSHLPSR